MRRTRSITYASNHRSRENSYTQTVPPGAWTLCRKFESFPARDAAMLQRWAEQGRVRPDDYLVSVERDLCVQARDVAELEAVFRTVRARLFLKISRGIACTALALALAEPLVGTAFLLGAFAVTVVCFGAARRSHPYSLYGTDPDPRLPQSEACDPGTARPA